MRLPNFLLIGAQKSGTSTLFDLLSGHPDVFMPKKELRYFDREDADLREYLHHFRSAGEATVIGEATPSYIFHPKAPSRIAATLHDVRLTAILRDPIDRAYSHYWHNRRKGREPLSFEEALEAESIRTKESEDYFRYYSYIARGFYTEQLERYQREMPEAPLAVYLFDDLTTRPSWLYTRVCEFLELDAARASPDFEIVSNPYRTKLDIWRGRLWKLISRSTESGGSGYSPMARATRSKLAELYAPEFDALSRFLGRDIGGLWGR